ncbi:MAG: JAB domain-containing protein [Lentisphaerae bacterium]|nr:JAB domain-containing protein [Lentisphaerota bacterium]
MNTKNMVVGYYTVVIGLADTAYAHPREVFRYAIMLNAASSGIILCHNHPSGFCEPSQDDIRLTSSMREAGKIIDIKLIDHIIVSEKSYFSFREKNML